VTTPRIEILRTIVEEDKSLLLRRKGGQLELVLGNVVLLSAAALETELHFGRLATHVTKDASVIIGGLGFGATLRGVLEVVSPSTKVIVVEKLKTVIDVARNEAAPHFAGSLDDPRVVIENADVLEVIANAAPQSLGAILLDVDNGPEWASFRTNARLYSEAALATARNVLLPGGIFAVWSGYPADAFLRTLRKAQFQPRIELLRERGVVRARAYVGVCSAFSRPS
jgi:spermidine synthase